jgi:hypothetical protein
MSRTAHELATAAVGRACDFLLAGQERDGFWRDYALPPGPSSEWVTAVVGYALGRAGSAFTREAGIRRGLSALRSSGRPSGWGYNAAVATDADTTSWVVRSFVRAGAPLPIEPIACLQAFVGAGGGARTFVAGARYGRWTLEHVDVTAVLGLAMSEAGAPRPALERLRGWLLDRRNGDGLWTSFWWTFDGYATARILEFLADTGGVPGDVVEAARHDVERRTAFTTTMEAANLLMVASRVGTRPHARVCSLLERQRADGGWPPSRVLKVPGQKSASPDEPAFEDVNGFMSTAMAVMALTDVFGKDGHDA